ncbi:CAAX prenyl protease-related protein [Duganella vulcania]|uniref:CAAX prenyl protease-related protein n=1 Tax=Duganella vulcania TaxID=2692166 RepID=A0A845GZB9_9BURK|nr:CAAX prenyl protease-related protein [Duganella vulcania]MYM98007.1 CAAX prenyl protease-related protein [Duganella vulcania]
MFDQGARARVLPFVIYIGFIIVADVLARCGWTAAELRWLYAVKVAAVLAALVWYRRRYTELALPLPRGRVLAVSVVCGIAVWWLWIRLNASWMVLGDSTGFDPRSEGRIDWLLVTVRLAGAALVVPVMEELFWRSFLMRFLDAPAFLQGDPARVKNTTFIITVLLFGFEHTLWFAGVVAGAVYTILYMRSRSLWAPVIAHGVTNGLLGIWIISTDHWAYW